ncbi:MAG: endonuclease V [Myxococcota bacterium]
MHIQELHAWPTTIAEAKKVQLRLRANVRPAPLQRVPRTVAGALVAQYKDDERLYAVVVVTDANSMRVLETVTHVAPARFPYVPGYLSFREMPPLLDAFKRLRTVPDVVISDRHGLAHPRRLGLASHLGLWLGVPTVGCCPTLLIGEAHPAAREQGATAPLLDEETGELVGLALRTRAGVNPVYVSTGHMVTLPEAAAVVLAQSRGRRMPEPLRLAHQRCVQLRKSVVALDPSTQELIRRQA